MFVRYPAIFVLATIPIAIGNVIPANPGANGNAKNFGNLKRTTIVSIQEINEKGEKVGEPIVPQDETSIVPTGR